MKILAVCGNGMGTSMVIKMKIKKILDKNNITASLESCSLGQAKSIIDNYDLIFASTHLVKELHVKGDKKLIGLKNLLDEKDLEEKLLEALG